MDARPPDTTPACAPGFLGCPSKKTVAWCSEAGGVEVIDCSPHSCSETLQRCDWCSPDDAPYCADDLHLTSCAPYGMELTTSCPDGCVNNVCCADSDNDQVGACDGDCDDNDPLTFPGQTEYQSVPRANGTYDYDCNGVDEPEGAEEVDCVRQDTGCAGSGWVGPVPGCGAPGEWAECQRVGGECQPAAPQTRPQACR